MWVYVSYICLYYIILWRRKSVKNQTSRLSKGQISGIVAAHFITKSTLALVPARQANESEQGSVEARNDFIGKAQKASHLEDTKLVFQNYHLLGGGPLSARFFY